MLESILILLVSMAGLAERAVSMPASSALRILWLAESIARCLVLDIARHAPQLAAPLLLRRTNTETLAERFLRLARALASLLARACEHSRDFIFAGAVPQPNVPITTCAKTRSLAWLALIKPARVTAELPPASDPYALFPVGSEASAFVFLSLRRGERWPAAPVRGKPVSAWRFDGSLRIFEHRWGT